MSKLINFKKMFQELHHHIGLGGTEAHPDVDQLVSGFMTPELYQQQQELFDKREFLTDDNGIDIFSLKPGFYSSNRFKNGPQTVVDQWLASVDIYEGYDGSRIYIYTASAQGDRWCCTTHYKNDLSTGSVKWLKFKAETLLWSGSSDLSTSIQLSGNNIIYRNGVWLYDRFRIEYTDSMNNVNIVETKRSKSANCTGINISQNDLGTVLEECNISFNKDNTITKDHDLVRRLVPSNVGGLANVAILANGAAQLRINTVWGIK